MRKYLLAISLLALITGPVFADNISVETVQLEPGKSQQFSVTLTNSKEYTAFQLDVTLPDGVSIGSGDTDGLAVSLTERKSDHLLRAAKLTGNTYRILAYSVTNAPLTGKDGAMLDLTLSASENITTGDKNGKVESFLLVEPDGNQTQINSQTFTIHVEAATPTPTPSTDGKMITVANNGEGKYYYATFFEKDRYKIAAAQNGGKVMVYSAYVDEIKDGKTWANQVYMEQLLVIGGYYWIPANTAVVVKSTTSDNVVAELAETGVANSMLWYENIDGDLVQANQINVTDTKMKGSDLIEAVQSEFGKKFVPYILAPIEEYGLTWTKFKNDRVLPKGTLYVIADNKTPQYPARLNLVWPDEANDEVTTVKAGATATRAASSDAKAIEVVNNGEGKYYYATFYEDDRYKIAAAQNDGKVMVYAAYVDEIKNGKTWSNQVYMEQLMVIGGYYWIPAYTPVIVKSTTSDDVVAELADEGVASSMLWYEKAAADFVLTNQINVTSYEMSGEDLKEEVIGSWGKKYVPYILAPIEEYGLTWTKFKDDRNIPDGTFYVVANNKKEEYPARLVVDLFDDSEDDSTTAIQTVKVNRENGAMFNLAGQKVNASYKGIIIKDGKKMILK